MKKGILPFLGVFASLVLFVLSSTRYPGGYDWANHTLSRLIQPRTLEGAENTSRPLAVLAVFGFCVSIAVVFNGVSLCRSCAAVGPTRH